MNTKIPHDYCDMVGPMRVANQRIVECLAQYGLAAQPYPNVPEGHASGSSAAKAYAIQGILKYHGIADWHWRTAYLPSISVNNDAAHTLTLVSFRPELDADRVSIGREPALGRERDRVVRVLDAVRSLARIDSRAEVLSRNHVRSSRTGKGLGTSASASAALAAAALSAAFGPSIVENHRLLSCLSRLLAGSGCRSAVGGVALWLSYPGIPHEDSYAVRLDQKGQLDDMCLITVPIDSRIGLKTEMAHREAPNSSFFRAWMQARLDETLECIQASQEGDWRLLARYAELDSIRLHGVTMSASIENKLFAWEPENIPLFRLCNRLRDKDVPVYFSTDTGPTTVLLSHRDHADAIVEGVEALGLDLEAVVGSVAGPVELIDTEVASNMLA